MECIWLAGGQVIYDVTVTSQQRFGVSNHRQLEYLLNKLLRYAVNKERATLRITDPL